MQNLLSVFTTLLSSIKEYGILNIGKAFMLMIMFSFVVRVMINPNFMFKAYTDFIRETHKTEMSLREKYDAEINKRMPVYLYKYHADRVFVVQYHNGVSDWQYGSMRFEEHKSGIEPLKFEHSNIHLSWLRLPEYLKHHNMFVGSIEDLKDVDRTLYESLKRRDTKYFAATRLSDESGASVGVFGITWNKDIPIDSLKHKIELYMFEDRAVLQNYTKPQLINAKIK